MPGVAVCIGALAPVEPSQRSAVFPADRIELAAPPLAEPQTMPWQKIGELPDQRFVGPYGIEFWRIHKGQVFHQGGLLRKPDAASFELMPAHHFIGRDAHAVYHAWTRQTSIDRDSFRQSGAHWLDNHAVYFEHETSLKALAGADCTTFRELGGGYGGDDHGGWYCGRRMSTACVGICCRWWRRTRCSPLMTAMSTAMASRCPGGFRVLVAAGRTLLGRWPPGLLPGAEAAEGGCGVVAEAGGELVARCDSGVPHASG